MPLRFPRGGFDCYEPAEFTCGLSRELAAVTTVEIERQKLKKGDGRS
jgi:hypothetical protein